ncbi:Leucyl aminopeptidase yscIV [Nowakowskiella sp. JEL0407]|nr:Leucyl aminopeptidase yscIV [Nowakowskiella sp. JEL0407]
MDEERQPLLQPTAADKGKGKASQNEAASSVSAVADDVVEHTFSEETPRVLPILLFIPTLAYFCGLLIAVTILAILVVVILGNYTEIKIIERIIGQNLPPYCNILGIETHLKAFDEIGSRIGNRAIGIGHEESAKYVIDKLSVLNGIHGHPYNITTQYFHAPVWKELAPPKVSVSGKWNGTLIAGVDIRSMRYGGPSAVLIDKKLKHVESGGCDESHFSDFPTDHIALIKAGEGCEPWISASNAEKANASAVIFYNPPRYKSLLGARVRIVEWKKGDPLMGIPVLSMTHSLGEIFKSIETKIFVSITVKNKLTIEKTFNVLAETFRGNQSNTIIVGAHLDGVPDGPGLVDNGSGSAAVLEVAIQLFKSGIINKLKNRIRFAWWGAEEVGLLGSRHYVRELKAKNPEEFKKIAMSLNHDMLGSPNGIPYIHDGYSAPDEIKNASIAIQKIYGEFWNFTHPRSARQFYSEPYEFKPMIAGSDFLPFVTNGIPTGGLETGAGEIISRELAERHKTRKVIANAPHDPCYHQKCDGLSNINKDLIEDLTKLVANIVEVVGLKKNLRTWLIEIGTKERARIGEGPRGYDLKMETERQIAKADE